MAVGEVQVLEVAETVVGDFGEFRVGEGEVLDV